MLFQCMQISGREEPGLAVCSREGQVLFAHAAPFGLQEGDCFTTRLAGGEARWLSDLSRLDGQTLICLTRRGEAVCFGVMEPGALLVLQPAGAPPGAVAEVVRRGNAAGVLLSPRMAMLPHEADDRRLEAAYAALCRLHATVWPSPAAADRIPGRQYADLLHRLADLPPLSSRRIALAFPDALPPVPGIDLRLWGSVAYCLAAFLCRSTADVPLQLTLTGTAGQLTLLLAAPPPCPVPPGSCTIDRLADRFFNAPELTVAAALAARSGAEVIAFGGADGLLHFACAACRFDPACIGLKQTPAVSDEAAEAEEAEWCRLLLAAVQAER